MEVGNTELPRVDDEKEDIDIVDIEEEMIVLKWVVIAFVDVSSIGKETIGETLDVLYIVGKVKLVAMLVVPVEFGSVNEGVEKLAVT